MFREEIATALKTKYKSFGLSNEAIDRIAAAREKTVTEQGQVETAVEDAETMKLIAEELQKQRDKEIQKRTDTQKAFDTYKADHPEKGGEGEGKEGEETKGGEGNDTPDMAKAIADAVAAAIKPLQESFDTYKAQHSAKEAKTVAREAFFANKWTGKFKDEANDAWERADELNTAQGEKMTADELKAKATEYFNKYVARKGADATKPFESEGEGKEPDFSGMAKHLEDAGLLTPEKKD